MICGFIMANNPANFIGLVLTLQDMKKAQAFTIRYSGSPQALNTLWFSYADA